MRRRPCPARWHCRDRPSCIQRPCALGVEHLLRTILRVACRRGRHSRHRRRSHRRTVGSPGAQESRCALTRREAIGGHTASGIFPSQREAPLATPRATCQRRIRPSRRRAAKRAARQVTRVIDALLNDTQRSERTAKPRPRGVTRIHAAIATHAVANSYADRVFLSLVSLQQRTAVPRGARAFRKREPRARAGDARPRRRRTIAASQRAPRPHPSSRPASRACRES